jgi:shikimate kinase
MNLAPNIILLGFMGSGKTTTGKELSKLTGFQFVDTDHLIEEKNNKKVARIFAEEGELFFRFQEKEAVKWLETGRNHVVSTGGGIWMDPENRQKLLDAGWCVWLKVTASTVLKRVENNLSQRPLLAHSPDPKRTIEELLTAREPFYSLAHVSFDTDGKNPGEVALEIFHHLKREPPFDLSEMPK